MPNVAFPSLGKSWKRGEIWVNIEPRNRPYKISKRRLFRGFQLSVYLSDVVLHRDGSRPRRRRVGLLQPRDERTSLALECVEEPTLGRPPDQFVVNEMHARGPPRGACLHGRSSEPVLDPHLLQLHDS